MNIFRTISTIHSSLFQLNPANAAFFEERVNRGRREHALISFEAGCDLIARIVNETGITEGSELVAAIRGTQAETMINEYLGAAFGEETFGPLDHVRSAAAWIRDARNGFPLTERRLKRIVGAILMAVPGDEESDTFVQEVLEADWVEAARQIAKVAIEDLVAKSDVLAVIADFIETRKLVRAVEKTIKKEMAVHDEYDVLFIPIQETIRTAKSQRN